jgi:hypothetical protein
MEEEKDDCRHGDNVCIRARATDVGGLVRPISSTHRTLAIAFSLTWSCMRMS